MTESDDDSRAICKYGLTCYQKNPEHHKKFKHPNRKPSDASVGTPSKRSKLDSSSDSLSPSGNSSEVSDIKGTESNSGSCVKDVLVLPEELKSRIEAFCLVQMPEDFYSFYEFCKSLNKKNPHAALAGVDLQLVGPYDLIDRDLKEFTLEEGLRHYRYYFDPPEFQTVLSCKNKQLLHYGYFRDSPKEMPNFVGSNEANLNCTISIVGENIFSALNYHLKQHEKSADPFKKMKIPQIQKALTAWCSEHNYNLDTYAKTNRERKRKTIAQTFHGVGIVVPYDKKTELGYRPLQENDKDLKSILQNLCNAESEEEKQAYWTKLTPVITFANIANDEFDFGAGLQLGIDLFSFGDPLLHKATLSILSTSYGLLGRSEFSKILSAHLENRTKGSNLNTIVKNRTY